MRNPCTCLALLVLLVAPPIGWSCAGPGEGSNSRSSTFSSRSQGTVLTYSPDEVWNHVRSVTQDSAQDVMLNETLRQATGRWNGGQVEISVEPYDSAGRKAILRVKAQGVGSNAGVENPELAGRVLIAIQQSLLGR